MPLPTPQPISTSHYCVIGDVSIHPQAKIAPGVVLQAAPHSKIEVAAGVCIGIGVVVQAYQGSVVIDVNATIGAGVLVVGVVKIGANACIGDSTTIIYTDIAALQVVPAESLLGDGSRPSTDYAQTSSSRTPTPLVENSFRQDGDVASQTPVHRPQTPANPPQSAVIGKAYVTQMLHVMFARN